MNRDNLTGTALEIVEQCDFVADMLLEKNRQYGDSALSPLRIFSGLGSVEQINVRIDDKLSRILSAQGDDLEDAELDLIGYLVLKRVAVRRQLANKAAAAPSRRRFYERVFRAVDVEENGVQEAEIVSITVTDAADSSEGETDSEFWRPVEDPQELDPVADPDSHVPSVEPRIMQQVQDLGFLCGKRGECAL